MTGNKWKSIGEYPISRQVLKRFIERLSASEPDFSGLFFKLNERDAILEIIHEKGTEGFVLVGDAVRMNIKGKNFPN